MSTLRRLLIFAILCFGLHFTNGRVGKIVHHTYTKGDSNLYVNINTFWSNNNNIQNLTYVTCPGTPRLHDKERNCTVGLRIEPELSCPVTFRTTESRVIGDYLEVFPFGPRRAIIFWADYSGEDSNFIKCTIVNLTTCQSTHHLELQMISSEEYSFTLAHSNYVVHENSFEFMIADPFDFEYLRKYHIDAEGNLLSKQEPWCKAKQSIDSVHPIVTDSEIKSYLYTSWGKDSISKWILAKCNGKQVGSEKVLQQIYQNLFAPLCRDVSTTHNTIGVTMGADSSILVSQFDLDGNLKLNMTLDFEFDVKDVSILNLAAGGFILTVQERKYDSNDKYDSTHLKMLKISSDKKIIGSVKGIEPIVCNNYITLQLFENEAKEYCVAILCSNNRRFNTGFTRGQQFAELEVRCYTDNDFTSDDTPSL